jgi:hypothetical protein
MPLILAIEPDRRQVSKLAMLARNYLHTELVVTDSMGRAMAMLDERVPDLILTSFQVEPKHRAALMDRLMEIDGDGTRVQTLVIPALGAPGSRASHQIRASHQKGMPAQRHGLRGNHPVADGCDPAVFGKQIAECLGRIVAGRRSAPARQWAPAVSPMISEPEPSREETLAWRKPPIPLAVAASHGSPRPESLTAVPKPAPPSRLTAPEWRDLMGTIRRDLDQMRAEHAEPSENPTDTTRTRPRTTLTPAPRVESPRAPAPRAESPRRIKRRTPSPAQDEWASIKRGFAMLAKANRITEAAKTPAKRPA